MKQDLQALLDSSEKIRVNQDKIIDNQKKQIETLQAINEKLEAELTEVHTYVRELTKDYGVIAFASFIVAFLFFVLFVISDKPQFNDTIIAKEGLWQRLNIVFMYLPIGVISIRNILEVK